jgi:6,7-dimethyl-8-ribityllumazine synthase
MKYVAVDPALGVISTPMLRGLQPEKDEVAWPPPQTLHASSYTSRQQSNLFSQPMDNLKIIEGDLQVRDLHFAIVAARFNEFIVEQLIRGAVDQLKRHGASDKQIDLIRVPGAFDVPVVARRLAVSKRYHAIVALGAVIKGATPHFDYVSGECAAGLARVAADTGIPVSFGVLTTDSIEQAIERAGTKAGNKGADAALVALELANLLRRLDY